MAAMQNDTYNLNGEQLTPLLLDIDLGDVDDVTERASRRTGELELLQRPGLGGCRDLRSDLERTGAVGVRGRRPEDIIVGDGGRWFAAVLGLSDTPDHRFWDDDADACDRAPRRHLAKPRFRNAITNLDDRFGDDPIEWRWGDLHRATFENQTLGQSGIGPVEALLNRGPVRAGGGNDIVNATGWTPEDGFTVDWLPSMRMIVDLSDFDQSLSVHTTGQSGHAYHPHYADFIDLWAGGEYYPMRFTEAEVTRRSTDLLQLVPGTH